MKVALCLQSVAVVDRQATFIDTSTDTSSMEVAIFTDTSSHFYRYFRQEAIFTYTSTEISSMKLAMCLQCVAVVDQQATLTDTSTRISSMGVTLCLQSVTVVD